MTFRRALLLMSVAGLCIGAGPASATTVVNLISGSFGGGVGSFSGEVTLNVVGGEAISGTGEISILGLSNAPLVLITTATPGNETAGGPSYPVGFRANDGTDLFGLDVAYPVDTAGLLFDVGTATAAWGQYPLLNLASGTDNGVFDGKVNGVEYYVAIGTTTFSSVGINTFSSVGTTSFSAVPEPATWAMMAIRFAALGYVGCRSHRPALSIV